MSRGRPSQRVRLALVVIALIGLHATSVLAARAVAIPVTAPRTGASDLAVNTFSPEEALAHDVALRAKGKGWTIEQAQAEHRVSQVLDGITSRIATERPDIFVGSKLSEQPGGTPTLYIKGPTDEFVWSLVEASPFEIDIADKQPYSFEELLERRDRVGAALRAMGFQDVAVRSNASGGGVIPAFVEARESAPGSTAVVLSRLPFDLQSSVNLTISATSLGTDTSSFGGMLVKAGSGSLATSGWSVTQIGSGTTGVTTAGHAQGANGIVHPGDGTHNFVFQSEHRGNYGDVE